jgi:hypothetical protein
VKILVDPKAVLFLLGTEMDYKADKMSAQFIFNNPNQTGACGCGESVQLTPENGWLIRHAIIRSGRAGTHNHRCQIGSRSAETSRVASAPMVDGPRFLDRSVFDFGPVTIRPMFPVRHSADGINRKGCAPALSAPTSSHSALEAKAEPFHQTRAKDRCRQFVLAAAGAAVRRS